MALPGLLAAVPPVSQEQFARLSTVVAVCWWALCFAIIFFMQCGFLLLEAGSVRAKNAAHVGAKVLAQIQPWLAGEKPLLGERIQLTTVAGTMVFAELARAEDA